MSNLSTFIGGGTSAKLWVSGETVTQWDYRKSPLDGEIYQRKTATGAGATDPANDTTNYKAVSYKRVLSIQNTAAGGGKIFNSSGWAGAFAPLIQTGPALTAAMRTSILSVTGRGTLNQAAFYAASNLSGTLRAELIIDGRAAVLDVTYATPTANQGVVLAGMALSISGSGVFANPVAEIEFKRSLEIWATSAGSTTLNQLVWGYQYTLES